MQFGLRIPSIGWPDLTYERTRALRTYCQRVEALGFHAIWVIDHYLPTPLIYAVSWLDPLEVLSFAASCTERIKLGTAILVLPFREPVLLAKQIATLDYLSGGRFLFGVGTGWDPKEFQVLGLRQEERGARTDEVLDVVLRLLTERNVTHRGRFFQFEDLTIEPMPPRRPPLWVAGGSVTHAPGAPEKPYVARGVLRRIMRADAWIARSSGSAEEDVRNDWEQVQAHARSVGRDPSTILFAHTQFLHIVDTADREKAYARQGEVFQQIFGTHRSFGDLKASYLMGTVDDMVARLEALRKIGLQYLILNPVTDEADQLDLIHKHLVTALR